MTESEALAYVCAAATALALPLTDERALRVAQHLHRTAALADLLDRVPMQPHDEPAEIYSPAAFQRTPDQRGKP